MKIVNSIYDGGGGGGGKRPLYQSLGHLNSQLCKVKVGGQ